MLYHVSMARKKNKPKHDEHKIPSKILREAKQQTGGGVHRSSKEDENRRKGRLKGAEKQRFRNGDYD